MVPALGALCLLSATSAFGQEFFRELGTSRSSGGIGRLGPGPNVFIGNDPYGVPAISAADLDQDEKNYNIRIGQFDLAVAAGVGFEFNDNITLSENNRISDVIFRPQVDFEGAIRFSESSRLHLGVGIGYAKYFNNSEFDSKSPLISPNSSIIWTAEVGAFRFTLRERLSYQEDPFAQPTVSNVATFRRWENQAGIQVDWDANQYTKIAVGYDRYDLWARDEFYAATEQGINTIFLRPSYQITPTFTLGFNASVSFVDFRLNTRADSIVYLIGPYVRWRVSDYLDVYAEVGYQNTSFDGLSIFRSIDSLTGASLGDITVDGQDGNSIYARLEIAHRPTEFFRHKLAFSRTSEIGFLSNFYDLYHVEYNIDWAINEKTSLRPLFFYEYYEASGLLPEKAHRFGTALGIYHVFSDSLTVGLDYRFLLRDSNLNQADFYQNLGLVSLYYKF
jgi:hypothetical protein